VAAAAAGGAGLAQCRVHHAGRHRVWAAGLSWQQHRDAELRRASAGGLLYSNMHTTALCSPSRSCIITGRNHHANVIAAINELATGYPDYNCSIPFENGFLSEMLLAHGYSTYMVGKHHLLPSEFESPAGPFDGGRSAVGSSGSTGSSAVTPASGIPICVTTIIRSSRRAPLSRVIT
jgi:arylsulfatase A-like enzyme